MRAHSSSSSSSLFKLSNFILFFIFLILLIYFLTFFHFFIFPITFLMNEKNNQINHFLRGVTINQEGKIEKQEEEGIEGININGTPQQQQQGGGENQQYLNIIKLLKKEIIELREELKERQEETHQLQQGEQQEQERNDLKITSISSSPSSSSSHTLFYSQDKSSYHTGLIILGMHRSGTSIVGGLINKMGLQTGEPLIQPNFDNEKGFFERVDVVLQNDYLMKKQQVHYSYRTAFYSPIEGIKSILFEENEGSSFFNEGKRALKFLNSPASIPWMLKDPRLCITLKTWLPFLSSLPIILFTYRNPFDVALSMHNRETEHFLISKGLKLWYIYNKNAIKQSSNLCRIITSHIKIMTHPIEELSRIYSELRYKCNMDQIHQLTNEVINDFIDIKLQHGKTSEIDQICQKISKLKEEEEEVNSYQNQKEKLLNQIVPPADKWDTKDSHHIKLYQHAVKLYCDMENQEAFQLNYQFDESITDD